jgi:hypothetical protein
MDRVLPIERVGVELLPVVHGRIFVSISDLLPILDE